MPGTATIKFSQRRASDVVFERAVGDAPFVFDSSAPFGFAYDSSPVSVLLAFQHAAREKGQFEDSRSHEGDGVLDG